MTYEIKDFSFASTSFYGFTVDKDTGRLTVSVINDGSEVNIPADDVVKDNQFRTWIWTKNTLQFEWSTSEKTHILMEIL